MPACCWRCGMAGSWRLGCWLSGPVCVVGVSGSFVCVLCAVGQQMALCGRQLMNAVAISAGCRCSCGVVRCCLCGNKRRAAQATLRRDVFGTTTMQAELLLLQYDSAATLSGLCPACEWWATVVPGCQPACQRLLTRKPMSPYYIILPLHNI